MCDSVQTARGANANLGSSVYRMRRHSPDRTPNKERTMSIGTILLVVLILMLVGVLPVWPHATSWGYGPSGLIGVALVVVIVLFLMGRL
jgi:membrane-bound ClpP family serine protease